MKAPAVKRTVLVVLALAAVAGVVTGREKPSLQAVEPRTPRGGVEVVAADLDLDLSKLQRAEVPAAQKDPFAPRSFAPPAPPVQQAEAAPPPPAAPSAPPLPFRYFGKLTEHGRTEVYVMRGDELLAIRAGEKIDAEYRVESIGDSAISFTYLPLKTLQSMDLPG